MPRFVGACVVNDERRVGFWDSIDPIGQSVMALGHGFGRWSIKLVEQILLLGVNELKFVEPGAPVSPGTRGPTQNTRIEGKPQLVCATFCDE
jgi:hypothetical protein